MFTTNNHQYWVIMAKSTFTPGVWFNGELKDNIRSSIIPFNPSKSNVRYRELSVDDPHISLT